MSRKSFKDENEFIQSIRDYIDYCNGKYRYPNISGYCAWKGIHRDTFYAQKEANSDAYKKVQDILEDEAINSPNADKTIKIFYLKNKYDYADKIDTLVSNVAAPSHDLSKLSNAELKVFKRLTKKVEKQDDIKDPVQ